MTADGTRARPWDVPEQLRRCKSQLPPGRMLHLRKMPMQEEEGAGVEAGFLVIIKQMVLEADLLLGFLTERSNMFFFSRSGSERPDEDQSQDRQTRDEQAQM